MTLSEKQPLEGASFAGTIEPGVPHPKFGRPRCWTRRTRGQARSVAEGG
jgi:hypothetical protein